MGTTRNEVSRILAVGKISSDGVHRLTQGETFVCCQGEEEEHLQLQGFCRDVEALLEASGLSLRDFTPEEFKEWLVSFAETMPQS